MTASPDGATLADHVVVAHNTATESTNKIHDDDVAQAYGFRGGLVPGVDVYAYMTHLPVRAWGRAWLERGAMAARFATPVYDGRTVRVTGQAEGDAVAIAVLDEATTCATGRAGPVPPSIDRPAPPAAQLPADPPPASANVVLGPWIHVSSELALLGTVADGETVEARAVVIDEFERKGHRFVTLDVAISADARPVQRVTHTAIYEPRRQQP